MTSFEKYKKILIKNNPELTDDEIKKILEFLALIAKQAISRYKNELLKKDVVKLRVGSEV